jgi:hypothetical protein
VTPTVKEASFFDTLKTVSAGFLGVRRRADHDRQTAPIKPLHIVIAGLVGGAILVGTLVVIVRLVVHG